MNVTFVVKDLKPIIHYTLLKHFYECDVCGNRFEIDHTLHTVKNFYECDVCGKRFETDHTLNTL